MSSQPQCGRPVGSLHSRRAGLRRQSGRAAAAPVAAIPAVEQDTRMKTGMLLLPLILAASMASPISAGPAPICSPPPSYWQKPHPYIGTGVLVIAYRMNALGQLSRDNMPISEKEFEHHLRLMMALPDQPNVLVDVRSIMERALQCRHTHACAEGDWAAWKKSPLPPGSPVS
jgi:hypothetical protein